jgi:hypothetical protein
MCDRCKEGRHCGLQTPGCRCKLCAGEALNKIADQLRIELQASMPPGAPEVPPIHISMELLVGGQVVLEAEGEAGR